MLWLEFLQFLIYKASNKGRKEEFLQGQGQVRIRACNKITLEEPRDQDRGKESHTTKKRANLGNI